MSKVEQQLPFHQCKVQERSYNLQYNNHQFQSHVFTLYLLSMQSKSMHQIPLEPPMPLELSLYQKEEKQVLPILQAIAMQCPICPHYPIFHILKFISKKFMLNQIESLFFVYMARQTNWSFDDPIITAFSGSVKDFISFKYDKPDYKSLVMYFVLISYSLKECLSFQKQKNLSQALKLCPQFMEAFEEWSDRYAGAIRGISPRTINYLYKSIVLGENTSDYTVMVDEIIRISVGYDILRKKEKKKEYNALKEEASNGLYFWQRPQKKAKVQLLEQAEFCATFSDSGIFKLQVAGSTGDEEDLIFGGNKIDELGIQISGSLAQRGMLVEPDLVQDRDEDYYEEFNIGANEGVSEQVVILHDYNDPVPQNGLDCEKEDPFICFLRDENSHDDDLM